MRKRRTEKYLEKNQTVLANVRKQDAIARLRTMQGRLNQVTSLKYILCFACKKNGEFRIYYNYDRHRKFFHTFTASDMGYSYYLKGNVTSYNGDAKITYYLVNNKREAKNNVLDLVISGVLALGFTIFSIVTKTSDLWTLLLFLFVALAPAVLAIVNMSQEKSSHQGDLKIMKDEMESIINGVRSYDDQDDY